MYRWAQLERQLDSLELNLLPGVPDTHLSQQTFVSFATISFSIAFSFSCCIYVETEKMVKTKLCIKWVNIEI